MRTPVIEAADLCQGYGRTTVLAGLDLSIGRGVTVLLGPNGAGKTTLLETVSTLRLPRSGSLRILGFDATRNPDIREIRRRSGFLPQRFGWFRSFTAREFVEYAAWLKLVPRDQVRAATERVLDQVGLLDLADRPMRAMSGGMLQRLGIAHAIVHQPELLILDEPTVGLDPEQRVEFRALIRRLAERAAVLISTHLVDDVRHVGGRVLVLSEGALAFTGDVDALEAEATADAVGDTTLERGYSSVLRTVRLGQWSAS
jgi:ABC-2 type transport system ATP-binding protein